MLMVTDIDFLRSTLVLSLPVARCDQYWCSKEWGTIFVGKACLHDRQWLNLAPMFCSAVRPDLEVMDAQSSRCSPIESRHRPKALESPTSGLCVIGAGVCNGDWHLCRSRFKVAECSLRFRRISVNNSTGNQQREQTSHRFGMKSSSLSDAPLIAHGVPIAALTVCVCICGRICRPSSAFHSSCLFQ